MTGRSTAHVFEGDHRSVLRDGAGEPECDGVRGVRDAVSRAVADIVLKPHARLAHPEPVHPGHGSAARGADLRDGPVGRTL